MTYPEILKLFGAPLSQVPKPHVPFKLKTWHVIAGAAIVGLTLYGGATLFKNAFGSPKYIHEDPTQSLYYKYMIQPQLKNNHEQKSSTGKKI